MSTENPNILIVASSPNPTDALSTNLARRLADGIAATHDDATVILRDVGATPPPVLDQTTIGAMYTPEDQRSPEQQAALTLSDTLIDELVAADVIVIAAPMHNFGTTAGLKTWFDQVARFGRTFVPTGQGPKGLLEDRPVYVITTRGGVYAPGTPFNHMDLQEPYIRRVLNFMGLEDITFIYAEGTKKDETGIKQAEAEIDVLTAGAATRAA